MSAWRRRVSASARARSGHVSMGALRVAQDTWQSLLPHQRTGLRWLWELHAQRCGGLLADEAPIFRRTLVATDILTDGPRQDRDGCRLFSALAASSALPDALPVLLVAPATLLEHWARAMHTWAPKFRCCALHVDPLTLLARLQGKRVAGEALTAVETASPVAVLISYEVVAVAVSSFPRLWCACAGSASVAGAAVGDAMGGGGAG